MSYDDLEPDWIEGKIGCRTIENVRVITSEPRSNFGDASELEIRWGEHDGARWLYACNDMFSEGTAYRNLGVPEPDYRHRCSLRSLRPSTSESIVALLASFRIFQASGADRIADALGLFTILTVQYGYDPIAVNFALSRLEGFSACRQRILG